LLMWIPASLIYVGVALYLVRTMFRGNLEHNSYRNGGQVLTGGPN
jgi:hypothetical protein